MSFKNSSDVPIDDEWTPDPPALAMRRQILQGWAENPAGRNIYVEHRRQYAETFGATAAHDAEMAALARRAPAIVLRGMTGAGEGR